MRGRARWSATAAAWMIAAGAAAQPASAPVPLPPPRPIDRPSAVPEPPVRPRDLAPAAILRPASTPYAPGPASPTPPPAAAAAAPAAPTAPPAVRPAAPPAPATPAAALPTPAPAIPLAEALACLNLFRGGTVEARAMPPVAPAGPGCGIAAPAEVSAVVLGPGQRVALVPPIVVDCTMAAALAAWIREDLAPAFRAAGAPLVALEGTSGYACRGRNGIAGARPSEHARGNAVDIGGFARADHTTIGVRASGVPLLEQVKATACVRFATVLGPGSDGFHESHMHVDLEERRNGARICHWERPAGGP